MKSGFTIVIAVCFAATALHAAAEEHLVSIELNAVPLAEALDKLQQASGIRLAYSPDLLEGAPPVTLSAENEPVGEILYRMLLPNGLVAVFTSADVGAIVQQASPMGMTKLAGRALRTFVRLELKLEAAHRDGDEVRVPGWTDADDRALLEAIADFTAAMFYLGDTFNRELFKEPLFLRMMTIHDKDVRVGVFRPAAQTYMRSEETRDTTMITQALRAMVTNEDEQVRASGILTACMLNRRLNIAADPVIEQAISSAANDPSPEVRFAGLVGVIFAWGGGQPLEDIAEVRKDANAAVRWMAWVIWMEQAGRGDLGAAMGEFLPALQAEPNPIAQALGVIFACTTLLRGGTVPAEVPAALEPDDPWLKTVKDTYLSIFSMMHARQVQLANPPDMKAEENGNRQQTQLFDKLHELALSGKRSHQVLGIIPLLRLGEAGVAEGLNDYGRIAQLADSDFLFARIAGIVACGAAPEGEGSARIAKALGSPDRIERLSALLACGGMGRRGPWPDAVKAAALKVAGSREYGQSMIAFRPLVASLPLGEAIEVVKGMIDRNPRDSGISRMIQSLVRRREFQMGDEETRRKNQFTVLDAIIESGNPHLQLEFLQAANWWFSNSEPLTLCMIYGCDLGVLERNIDPDTQSSVGGSSLRFALSQKEYGARAMLDRLGTMFDEEGGDKTRALRLMGSYLNKLPYLISSNQSIEKMVRDLATRMMAATAGADSVKLFEARCSIITSLIRNSQHQAVKRLLSDLESAAVSACNRAGDAEFRPAVVSVLAALHSRGDWREYPDLKAAADVARNVVLDQGTQKEQVRLLSSMHDEFAWNSLQERFLAGTIPASLRIEAMESVNRRIEPVRDDFADYLLKRIADDAENLVFRQGAARALCRSTRAPALIDLLEGKSRQPGDMAALGEVLSVVPSELNMLRKQEKLLPAWTEKAAAIGLSICENKGAGAAARLNGLKLYAQAGGDAGLDKAYQILFDKDDNAFAKTDIASVLIDMNLPAERYKTFADNYHKLPANTRSHLWQMLFSNPIAPIVEVYIKDRHAGQERIHVISRIDKKIATPGIIEALKSIQDDPNIGDNARRKLKQLLEQ